MNGKKGPLRVNWALVDENTDSGCWVWTGCCAPNGYGRATIQRQVVSVHRVAYEELVGPIPDGLHIDHLCRNKACCNPAHLEPVTQAENNRRAAEAKWGGKYKTRCIHGHSLEDAYIRPNGQRRCSACHRIHANRRSARLRAERVS